MHSLSIRINIYKIFVKWEVQIIKYFSKPLALVNTRRVGLFVFERNLALLGKKSYCRINTNIRLRRTPTENLLSPWASDSLSRKYGLLLLESILNEPSDSL